ncbi:hypothetical protein PV325_012593 [Microctonus aethiopoides]|uniref:Uncharacterized protein n=1 Tax=Microctonus aethiopoides TaxID=144406 RepID=A0AA39KT10_9HYME|nr:hypothetical protein PV325_012593 [Microctonus aethiopoides]KAK0172541.1 hypothetical protein PV328_005847 [Microctonus aethiopoides]
MLPRSHNWRDCTLFAEEARSLLHNYHQLSFQINQSRALPPQPPPPPPPPTTYHLLPTVQVKPGSSAASPLPHVLWWNTPGTLYQVQVQTIHQHFHRHHHHHLHHHHNNTQQQQQYQQYQQQFFHSQQQQFCYQNNRRTRTQSRRRHRNNFRTSLNGFDNRNILRPRSSFTHNLEGRLQAVRGMETRFNEGISQEPQAVPQGSEEDPSGVACEALLESQYNSDLELSRL